MTHKRQHVWNPPSCFSSTKNPKIDNQQWQTLIYLIKGEIGNQRESGQVHLAVISLRMSVYSLRMIWYYNTKTDDIRSTAHPRKLILLDGFKVPMGKGERYLLLYFNEEWLAIILNSKSADLNSTACMGTKLKEYNFKVPDVNLSHKLQSLS